MTAPRRWFRFILRALFVVVTVVGMLAGWVVYQLNWIRERHNGAIDATLWRLPNLSSTAPWPHWLFGEQGSSEIILWQTTWGREVANGKRFELLFPEAEVSITGTA